MKDYEFRDLVERIREHTDIVRVIGQHIDLDQHYKAICPFHVETKPSFSVNPNGQYFHCFGCRVSGDVFRFLELYEMPKPANGRLGDILKPLQQIIRLVRPEREPAFMKLVKELESEKLIEKMDSLEAQILMTLIGLKSQVENRSLRVKSITNAFNEGKTERNRISYPRVGRRLAAMGFKKAKTGNGASAIIWDEESIERMKDTYGLRETSETSDRSETPEEWNDVTDVSEVTDVSRNLF